jgi:hypothetical protein
MDGFEFSKAVLRQREAALEAALKTRKSGGVSQSSQDYVHFTTFGLVIQDRAVEDQSSRDCVQFSSPALQQRDATLKGKSHNSSRVDHSLPNVAPDIP